MKFRFESSTKEIELNTQAAILTVDEFLSMIKIHFFKDKEPTCSFNVTNFQAQDYIECNVDVPIIKKVYNKIFVKPTKMKMVKKKVKRKRWRSHSPKRKKRRWRSRTPPQRYEERFR